MASPFILEPRRHSDTSLPERIAYAFNGAMRLVVDSASGHDEQAITHLIKILTSIYVPLPLLSIVSILASVVLHNESLIEVAKIESHPPAAVLTADDQVHRWLR